VEWDLPNGLLPGGDGHCGPDVDAGRPESLSV